MFDNLVTVFKYIGDCYFYVVGEIEENEMHQQSGAQESNASRQENQVLKIESSYVRSKILCEVEILMKFLFSDNFEKHLWRE